MKNGFYLMNNFLILFLLINIFFLKSFICHCECDIDTPIFIENECKLQYCTKNQFDSGDCTIKNDTAKIQWLNNIILIDFYKLRFGNLAMNSNGDMIFECSDEEIKGKRVFYGLKKDGSFYFNDENGNKVPTKIITVIDETQTEDIKKYPPRYESSITFISINNNEYLFSISLHTTMVEIYDLENNEVSFFSTIDFTSAYNIYTFISILIEIKNCNNKQYLHTFIGQKEEDQSYHNFYLISQIYSFSKNKISLGDGYTIDKKIEQYSVQHPRVLSGFLTNSDIFVLFYLENKKYIIETYNKTIAKINSEEIGTIEGDNIEEIFYKSINIKNNIGAFIFYLNENCGTAPQLQIIEIIDNGNSFTKKFNFQLYNVGEYSTHSLLNDLIKINDKRLSFISSSNNREKLYIILFDFSDSDNKIRERIYKIYLYGLYNYVIYRELSSISYNDYLTLSLSACYSYPCDKSNSNSNYYSLIIIFGYINGTETNINISHYLSEFSEINNNENIIDALLENIKIDNNIFGFEFQKQIKLISIPQELNFYNIVNGENIIVNEGEILSHDYNISQNNNVKMRNKTYYFEFQFIAKEEINDLNKYTIGIIIENSIGYENNEENFESQIFYGKKNKIEFKLCYDLCDTCEYLGISFDDQKCLTCNENLTNYNGNCYPEGYITEYATEYRTEFITDYITEKTTETMTDYITQTDTEYITDYITQTDTEYITDYITQTDTEYITDYITQTDTEYITDYITQTDTEYITDYITDYITERKETEKVEITTLKKETNCSTNFYSKDNDECLEYCLIKDLQNDNCEIKDVENKNTIIDELIRDYLLKNFTGENVIIEGNNNTVFQLTNSLNENNAKDGINSNDYNLSMIDLGECENKLKEAHGIDKEESLIIYKKEIVGTVASQKDIQYEVYNPNNLEKLDVSICINEKINIYIPVSLSEDTLKLQKDLLDYGYDLFNENDSFYQDICAAYTSVNGTDMLLSDRRAYLFNNTETACQQDCSYSQYSAETRLLKCECSAINQTIEPEPAKSEKFDESIIITSFYDVLKMSNFRVLKCYKLVFSYKGEYHNWGSMILIGYFVVYTIFNIMYFIKGFVYAKLYSAKMIFHHNNYSNNINITKVTKKITQKLKKKKRKRKRKSLYVGNPLRKKKNKSKGVIKPIEKKDKDLSDIKILKNSRIIKGGKSKILKSLNINKNESNSNDLIKKGKNYDGNNIFRSLTKNLLINKDGKKRKVIGNSIKILEGLGKKFNNKKNGKKVISYNNGKNVNTINININNRNSIKVFNHKSKNASSKPTKKNLFSYFRGNNFSDYELNELSYKEAVDYDKRSFPYFYWQLLRREHLIFFTFFSWDDNNILFVKLSKFIVSISVDFALNVIFFFDESMHKIYLDYGKYNFIAQIPQTLYSTIASESFDVFLRYLCIIEKDIYQIKKLEQKKNKNIAKQKIFKVLKCMRIKLIFYFIVTFFIMCFFWYIIAAFCAVYKNTQHFLIKDSMVSLLMSLLYPFGLYLLPAGLRIIAIRDKEKRLSFLYKLSDIIPLI